MLYTNKELKEMYGNTYQINRALAKKEIFKIQKGIYSNIPNPSVLEIINKKYPRGIFTMDSAFYYYNLTDVIPEYYYLATDRNDTKIKDQRIKQLFVVKKILYLGKTEMTVSNVLINIYDKERLLIELIRNRKHMAFDYYKEIISNYRKISSELDTYKIAEYISCFKNEEELYDALMREVF